MRKYIIYITSLIIIPSLLLIGVFIFDDKQYDIIAVIVALLSMLPFFLSFENRKPEAREIVLIAVLTALCVSSRIIFVWTPSFKPVSAIIIIIGLSFNKEIGFMVGSLTALLSNMYFGQGPWTIFQMFAWGLIGFMSGLLSGYIKEKNTWILLIFGIIAGLTYSLIMDFQTMLAFDNAINLKRYLLFIINSLPMTIMYMVSNVIFLLLLKEPLVRKFKRVIQKYELYSKKTS